MTLAQNISVEYSIRVDLVFNGKKIEFKNGVEGNNYFDNIKSIGGDL